MMNVLKSSTEFLTRIGDALKPHTEAERKAQAISALVILTALIIIYIVFIG